MGQYSKIVKRNIAGNWQASGTTVSASLSTNLTGSNNDLVYTAKAGAAKFETGNDITVRYVVSGNSTPLSVSVSTNAITVNVATDSGGAATSTAAQVKAAVEASTPAAALVSVAHKSGNDGSGVVTALSATALTGGRDYVIGSGR